MGLAALIITGSAVSLYASLDWRLPEATETPAAAALSSNALEVSLPLPPLRCGNHPSLIRRRLRPRYQPPAPCLTPRQRAPSRHLLLIVANSKVRSHKSRLPPALSLRTPPSTSPLQTRLLHWLNHRQRLPAIKSPIQPRDGSKNQ